MVKLDMQKQRLTMGVFTPKQAARYARVTPQVVNRWVYGDNRGRAVLHAQIPEFGKGEENLVTFLDFVQAMAIRSIRHDQRFKKRISLQRIRTVVDLAAEEYKIEHPLARKHKTYLFEDDIVIRLDDGDTLIQITGRYKKNQLLNEVVELYAEDLSYDKTGLANRYVPMRSNDGNRSVELNPRVRFGEPVVCPCGYSVDALVGAVLTEGGENRAARAYGVAPEDVKLALRYNDWLLGNAA